MRRHRRPPDRRNMLADKPRTALSVRSQGVQDFTADLIGKRSKNQLSTLLIANVHRTVPYLDVIAPE